MNILDIFILIISLSIDIFVCSFVYGFDGIKIKKGIVVFISLLCSIFLLLSMVVGLVFSFYITNSTTKIISFSILFIMGIIKMLTSFISFLIKKNCNGEKQLQFSLSNLKFNLLISAETFNADKDYSKTLSIKEASFLSLALSFDNIGVGMGFGMISVSYIEVFLLSFIIGILSIMIGFLLGKKLSNRFKYDLSFISGIILVALAILKL